MATEIDTSESTAPPQDLPAPGGRPDHTIISILVMLVLSAGVLYGADWLLRDDGVVVQAWDFTGAIDTDAWTFPDPEGTTTSPAGTTFALAESGFGPKLNLSINAADVRRIQAKVTVTDARTGKPVPFALGWYWARSEDLAESPEQPFSPARSMVFYPFARHRPDTLRTDIYRHGDWQGTIDTGVFTLKFPEGAAGPFRVTLSRLEFLE